MRALLDVNVLIALLDADHSLHARATHWFETHARRGWASCPITQNGCVRIMSHPGYPNALPHRFHTHQHLATSVLPADAWLLLLQFIQLSYPQRPENGTRRTYFCPAQFSLQKFDNTPAES